MVSSEYFLIYSIIYLLHFLTRFFNHVRKLHQIDQLEEPQSYLFVVTLSSFSDRTFVIFSATFFHFKFQLSSYNLQDPQFFLCELQYFSSPPHGYQIYNLLGAFYLSWPSVGHQLVYDKAISLSYNARPPKVYLSHLLLQLIKIVHAIMTPPFVNTNHYNFFDLI